MTARGERPGPAPMPAPRGILADRRGTTALEYALILPALLMLILGIMDVGRLVWVQGTLEYATAAAARCAAVNATDCTTTAQVQAYGVARAFGMTLATSDFTVTTEACGRRVAASRPFTFVTPWVTPQDLTLAASACYPAQP